MASTSSAVETQKKPEEAILEHVRLLIQVQYSSRLPVRSKRFRWPSDDWLLKVQGPLAQALFDSEETATLADTSYDKTFLKALISRIERAIQAYQEEEHEVDPLLLERYAELMAMPSSSSSAATSLNPMDRLSSSMPFSSHAPPPDRMVEYWFPCRSNAQGSSSIEDMWRRIRLCEASSALVGSGTTACKTWEAAVRLASHLLCHRDELVQPGSRVLELGSGTGLVSMLMAYLMSDNAIGEDAKTAGSVYATDLPVVVASKLQPTIDLNEGISRPQLCSLDWSDPESSSHLLEDVQPTLILGADIVFDPDICQHLVSVLYDALRPRGSQPSDGSELAPQALIASTVRNPSTYSRFLALLDAAGLQTEEVKLDRLEVEPPTTASGADLHGVPTTLPFDSGHDEAMEGVVKGLRIWLQ